MRKPSAHSPALEWIDRLTHPSVAANRRDLAQHRAFIATRLAAAASFLLASPLWVAYHGAPTPIEGAAFLLTQTPLVAVVVLAYTGKLRLARSITLLGWFALGSGFGVFAPGYEAAAIMSLTVAVVEAALSFDIAMVFALAGATLALLALGAGLREAGMLGAGDGFATTGVAALVAPFLCYLAILAVCAVRTERASANHERRKARDLRFLTDAVGDLVIRFDHGGAVLSIAGKTANSRGLNPGDLIGRGFFQRVHVADRPAFLKLVSDAAAHGGPAAAELRLRVSEVQNPSGRFIEPVFNIFEARTCHVDCESDPDHPQPVVCILRDVTAIKRAEEHIAAARLESEMAIAGKTRFLANVSHELRTPLNAIIGFSEMLAREDVIPTNPAKRREYAEIINVSGQHLLSVVNAILDMSKIESGSMQLFPEPFSLSELVDQCCDMMQLETNESEVVLIRDYRSDLEKIVADKRACKQIIINVLSNAVKFTPARGRVKVDLYPEGNSLVVCVGDDGIGISPNDLAQLGNPFFQASSSHDRTHEGTGLGLSVVRGLVGLHGGSITVESAPHDGTCVTVRLPLDCRNQANGGSSSAKIETILRCGRGQRGNDLVPEKETVKKIA